MAPPAAPSRARVLHGWLVLGWLVAVVAMAWRWCSASFSLDGLSPVEQAVSDRAFLHLAVVLLAGPVVLVAVAALAGRTAAAVAHAVVAGIALLLVGPPLARDLRDAQPAPPPGPPVCVERSGGDSDCPGG